ncbi:hypothetical protein R0595_001287 [Pluralibacter gergoviae]|nr:hypothetical protein [Pluralibacter gergoviae]ELW9440307.1 hypothetical protein [Pluralibacter gergoviae]
MTDFAMHIFIDAEMAILSDMLEQVEEPLDYESILSIIGLIPTSMELYFAAVKVGDPMNVIKIKDSATKRSIIEATNKLRISPEQFVKGCLSLMIVGGGLNAAL